jgi:hypothetical protein
MHVELMIMEGWPPATLPPMHVELMIMEGWPPATLAHPPMHVELMIMEGWPPATLAHPPMHVELMIIIGGLAPCHTATSILGCCKGRSPPVVAHDDPEPRT